MYITHAKQAKLLTAVVYFIESLLCGDPGCGPCKPTFNCLTMDWTQRGDTPKIKDDKDSTWKWLRSSPGLARDDDDDDDDDDILIGCKTGRLQYVSCPSISRSIHSSVPHGLLTQKNKKHRITKIGVNVPRTRRNQDVNLQFKAQGQD